MKTYITVEEIRQFLNLADFYDDDLLLINLLEAAQLSIEHHINRSLESLEDDENNIPQDLQVAIKSLVATWYTNRESVSYGVPNKIPYTMEYIIQPYKNYKK